MRKHSLAWLIGALASVLLMLAPLEGARAQNSTGLVVATCGTPPSAFVAGRPGPYTVDVNGNNCITGSFSATLAGFTPNGNFATLTATAASSGSTALPVGAVVAFQNKSAIDLSCVLSAGAATATTDKLIVRAGATVFFTVGANVNAACINQTGVASNVVVMAGGAGLGTNFGGGGSGGGAVTIADGANVALGSTTDAVAATPASGTAATLIALSKAILNNIASAIPTGTNRIGYVTDDPCSGAAVKAFLPITATTSLVKVIAPGVAAKKIAICQLLLTNTAADNVAVFEATTGTTCATSPVAVYGAGTSVATAANGFAFPANGGVSLGNGGNMVGQTTVNNNDLCIGTSAATPLTGGITYVTQ